MNRIGILFICLVAALAGCGPSLTELNRDLEFLGDVILCSEGKSVHEDGREVDCEQVRKEYVVYLDQPYSNPYVEGKTHREFICAKGQRKGAFKDDLNCVMFAEPWAVSTNYDELLEVDSHIAESDEVSFRVEKPWGDFKGTGAARLALDCSGVPLVFLRDAPPVDITKTILIKEGDKPAIRVSIEENDLTSELRVIELRGLSANDFYQMSQHSPAVKMRLPFYRAVNRDVEFSFKGASIAIAKIRENCGD